ncbi:MAG: hypothetical protein Aurels2KO_53930 [Aureliella sp.]
MSNSAASASSATYRPWLLSLTYASAWGYAAAYCHKARENSDSELYTVGFLFACFMATVLLVKALDDRGKLKRHRKMMRRFKASEKAHGPAAWATKKDLKQRRLVGSNAGIFLGMHNGKEIWESNHELSINLFGAPGTGKSSGPLATTLLNASARTVKERRIASSFIVNDSAGDLYGVASGCLRRRGYKVVLLSCWANQLSELVGEVIGDDGLNLCNNIRLSDDIGVISDEAKFLTKLLVPNEPPNTSEENKFFNRGGRQILEFIVLYLVATHQKPTLGQIKEIASDPTYLHELYVDAIDRASHHVAKLASTLLGMKQGAAETYAAYQGVVDGALDGYSDFGAVGQHLNGVGFDPRELKYGEQPVAAFLHYPAKRIVTHHALLNAELQFILESVCSGPRGRNVTALLDEIFGARYIDSLLRFLSEGRKHGLRTVLGWQDAAQAELIYSKPGFQQIIANCQVLWATGVREAGFAETLKQQIGLRAISGGDLSLNNRSSSTPGDLSLGMSQKGLPMIHDLRTQLGADNALLLHTDMPPCVLQKRPYYLSRFAKFAGRNPYAG